VIFAWNERNTQHIGKHGVEPGEAEYVVRHAKPPFPRRMGEEKLLVWGRGADGAYLQVVFVYLPDERVKLSEFSAAEVAAFEAGERVILVIHAMEMTNDMKRQYRKLRGRR
jgi:uncharacterized DUF497 family protein